MRYVTPKEVSLALERASELGETEYLIIKTLALTGLRVSELVNIKPGDINEDKTLIVRGKGNHIRVVDIPGELANLLKIFIRKNRVKNKERVFPLNRTTIGRLTKKLINKNPHAFRHGYAIALIRKTKNVRYVQKQLGHSSLSITGIYLQYMEFNDEINQLPEIYS